MSEAIALPAPTRRPWPGRLSSDDRLVRRATQGDQRAFAAIFERYHQDLYRYCQAILGNPEDGQDALQNTMVKVLGALPGEKRTIQLKPWLYRIAHNEAIELLRRRRPTEQIDSEMRPAVQSDPAQTAETQARLRQLFSDINELPERQRGALVMRELSGLGSEEIGAALGTTDAVARQAIYEARASLQQMGKGREMSCESVMRALSDGDSRTLRGRQVRAHLRSCASCTAFKGAIASRRRDLAALSPLPVATSAGLLGGLLGGSHGGSGGAGGLASALGAGAGKTLATSALLKSAAALVAVAAVGAGAADAGGLIHFGLPGQGHDRPARSSSAPVITGTHRSGPRIDTTGSQAVARTPREGSQDSVRGPEGGQPQSPAAKGTQPQSPSQAPASQSAHGAAPSPLPDAAAHGQESAAAHRPEQPVAGPEAHPPANSHPTAPVSPPNPPPPSPSPPIQPPAPSPPAVSTPPAPPGPPAPPSPPGNGR